MSYSIFSKCGTTQPASTAYRAKPPPTWSAVPLRAIAVRVRSTSPAACSDPVRAACRRRNSHTIDGGNFGAPPNPPWTVSSSAASAATAASSAAASGTFPAGGAIAPRAAAMRPELASTSSRRSRHASPTAASTCRNEGSCGCGRSGKYVPAKNTAPSGVQNVVMGQPP